MKLPQGFTDRMEELLGAEADAFFASYERPHRRALRVNTAKISAEEFLRISPFPLEAVPWTENGFYCAEEERPSQHPYYAAGLYYLQEPSAMAPAAALPLEAGDRVLDLCAAPGGKATELAARLAAADREHAMAAGSEPEGTAAQRNARPGVSATRGKGILVANEIHPARAKALLHNLELNGTDNYCVLNESPERLAEAFPQFFDKILVDAPCSGEGMFRKEEAAVTRWSPAHVQECAAQQEKILEAAYAMLRPGGSLLYSTCTFAPEENEMQILSLLKRHPDLQLQTIPLREGFAPGITEALEKCVRLWPHRIEGEGHFLTLMKKADEAKGDTGPDLQRQARKKKQNKKDGAGLEPPTKDQKNLLRQFLCAIVRDAAIVEAWPEQVLVWQEKAFLAAFAPEQTQGLHIVRNGLFLGEWKKNRFEPSQTLALHLSDKQIKRAISFSPSDARLAAFRRGESFPAEGEAGWIPVLADRFPIGWGKITGGLLKNHYPAGWRK